MNPGEFPVEFLQPSLFDRLKRSEPDEPWRPLSMTQLRAALYRDLETLFNTSAANSDDPIWNFPLASRSVLNYGVPPVVGQLAFARRPQTLELTLHRAVDAFEPRIIPGSLSVRGVQAPGGDAASLSDPVFEIVGEFCPLPNPESMMIRTRFGDAGRCTIQERTDG